MRTRIRPTVRGYGWLFGLCALALWGMLKFRPGLLRMYSHVWMSCGVDAWQRPV